MLIVAVVVNWNRPDDTVACVESLAADAPGVAPIVVDNGSRDGSAEEIARRLPAVTLVRSSANRGYAGGNNLGIARALADGADGVLILNNDLTVRPGCVDGLVRALGERPEWGIVGPLTLRSGDGETVDFFTGEVSLEHVTVRAPGRDEPRAGRFDQPAQCDYVTGSCLLVRREVLERTGGFDERFFLVWEDVDLCLRARASGWSCGVTPDAVAFHQRSKSFGGEGSPLYQYFFARNAYLIARNHLPFPMRWRAEARATRRFRAWSRTPGDPAIMRALAAGLRDGLLGRYGPPPRELMAPVERAAAGAG